MTFRVALLLACVVAWAPLAVRAGVIGEFVVNSTLDEPDAGASRDGACVSTPSGVCTLRAAIQEVDACVTGDAKTARARLKLTLKALAQYRKRLQAAKKVDPRVRADFTTAGAAIKANVKARRASIACPADAAS